LLGWGSPIQSSIRHKSVAMRSTTANRASPLWYRSAFLCCRQNCQFFAGRLPSVAVHDGTRRANLAQDRPHLGSGSLSGARRNSTRAAHPSRKWLVPYRSDTPCGTRCNRTREVCFRATSELAQAHGRRRASSCCSLSMKPTELCCVAAFSTMRSIPYVLVEIDSSWRLPWDPASQRARCCSRDRHCHTR